MKKIFIFLIFFVYNVTMAKESIVFAPLPMQDKTTVLREFYPMIEHLQKKTQREFKVEFFKSYDILLKKFIQGEIDLLYLGPLPYITLEEQYSHIKPLIFFNDKDGATFYTCSLIAFMSTKIDFSKPIEEKTIALTQPLSTCGYLSVNHILGYTKSSLEKNHYSYIGRHDKVALHVAQKKALLGGVKTSIAKQYYKIGIDILATTDPMPMFALVGNSKTLSKEILDKIQNTLLQTPKSTYKSWGEKIRFGMNRATDKDYTYIKKLKQGIDIPKQGNILP